MSDNKFTRKKINKVWKAHSYVVAAYDNRRRMTEIGFLQAIQKLGIKIEE